MEVAGRRNMTASPQEAVMRTLFAGAVLIVLAAPAATPAHAQNHAEGTFVVGGKTTKITQVYAHAQPGFFDKNKLDVVVLLCDAAVSPQAQRDDFARRELIKADKLHCIQQTIDAAKQVIGYRVEHSMFEMTPSGGSTYQVFEAKTYDGKTIAGRARTTETQKSFDDVPYTYDVTFSAAIAPK
jgi:hypothetical protein